MGLSPWLLHAGACAREKPCSRVSCSWGTRTTIATSSSVSHGAPSRVRHAALSWSACGLGLGRLLVECVCIQRALRLCVLLLGGSKHHRTELVGVTRRARRADSNDGVSWSSSGPEPGRTRSPCFLGVTACVTSQRFNRTTRDTGPDMWSVPRNDGSVGQVCRGAHRACIGLCRRSWNRSVSTRAGLGTHR